MLSRIVSKSVVRRLICFHGSERGVSLLEFAIVGPFLFGITLALLDIGTLIVDYMNITQAVRAGTRAALGYNGLDTGTVSTLDADYAAQVTACNGGTGTLCGHRFAIERVKIILQAHGQLDPTFASRNPQANWVLSMDYDGSAATDTVTLRYFGSFQSLLFGQFLDWIFGNHVVRVTERGPYLGNQ